MKDTRFASLHGESGPAIEFHDGHQVYAWHGTEVPAEWIERRETLDPSLALVVYAVHAGRSELPLDGMSGTPDCNMNSARMLSCRSPNRRRLQSAVLHWSARWRSTRSCIQSRSCIQHGTPRRARK